MRSPPPTYLDVGLAPARGAQRRAVAAGGSHAAHAGPRTCIAMHATLCYRNYDNHITVIMVITVETGARMAKPLVTERQVFAVADQLQAMGTDPTIITVQERIGGGSYTTVKRYLDAWKQQQTRQPVVEVPADVTAQGMVAIQALWTTAAQLAHEQVAHDRAEVQRQVVEAQAALAAAEGAITRQEVEAEQLGAQLSDQQQQIDELTAQLAQARTDAAAASAMLQEQGERVRDLQQELERAHTQHATLTATLDRQAAQYEHRLQEARTERQTALEQAQALLVENGRLTGELAVLRPAAPTTDVQ